MSISLKTHRRVVAAAVRALGLFGTDAARLGAAHAGAMADAVRRESSGYADGCPAASAAEGMRSAIDLAWAKGPLGITKAERAALRAAAKEAA